MSDNPQTPSGTNTPAMIDETNRSAALPGPVESAVTPPDIDPPRDIGWMITLAGAVVTMLAAFTLFGNEVDAMWAGYWVSLFGTSSLLGSFLLRSTLPAMPGYLLTGASGAGLVLVAVVQGYSAMITVPMIAGGAVIIAGVGIAASSRR